jgi:POT family proton-dependent oligopeptide transporter
MTTDATLKQPSVFKFSCLTAMFERFGFYILTYTLVLFAKEKYGITDSQAFLIFGIFTALAFVLPAIGGYLADNVYGIKRSMLLGLILETVGLSMLAIPNYKISLIALAFVVTGVGFFRTGPNSILGRSYKDKDPRIDSGFTLFYMAINVGGISAAIASGLLQKYFGWNIAFLVAGLGGFTSIILYFIFKHTAKGLDSPVGEAKKISAKAILALPIGLIAIIAICSFLILHNKIAYAFLDLVIAALLGYYIFEIIRSPKKEKLKIIACLCLIIIGMLYFIFYMQLYTSLALFIERNVDRTILGFQVPTELYFSLNPFWVIVMSPLLAMFYKWVAKKYNHDFAITTKFTVGLFAVTLAFFILSASSMFADSSFKVASFWIAAVLGFITLGEMLISALGPAMVTHILPKRMYGVTMGAWFASTGFAAAIAGVFAGIANVPKEVVDPQAILHIYSSAFLKIGAVGLIFSIIVLFISPFIKRMAALK